MKRIPHALLLLLGSAASPLAAQAVRGQLVDEGGRPVAAAFVILQDSTGAASRRALSSSEGRFFLSAAAPGLHTLRVERIGYSSTVSPPLRLPPADTVDYRMRLASAAVILDGISVSGTRRCDVRPGQGAAAALWEEARKALSVSAWADSTDAVRVRLVEFQRGTDRDGTVQEARASESERTSRMPFSSAPAEELARDGYRQLRGTRLWYYAPDAVALTSDAFLDTHCFAAVRGSGAEEGLVGLAFEPVARRGVPDVRGTLWIDPVSRELRHLEYRYTRLPAGERHPRVGGRVEFERLPNGAWIVSSWVIRMPRVRAAAVVSRRGTPGRLVLTGFVEVGGEVREIRDREGNPIRLAAAPDSAAAGAVPPSVEPPVSTGPPPR